MNSIEVPPTFATPRGLFKVTHEKELILSFFDTLSVWELVFQRVLAEKLVKSNRLQILHYVIVF